MRTVAVVQARMTSTRLPGKVLRDVEGKPMLARVIDRLRLCVKLDDIGVATSHSSTDDVIEELCTQERVLCYRGNLEDVLDRYYEAAQVWGADVVVRITADCPLIDPLIVDQLVELFFSDPNIDHCSNVLPTRTYPRGLDAEVFPFRILKHLWKTDKNPHWREHVTESVFQNPSSFQIRCLENATDFSHYRWTVDTAEDLSVVQRVFAFFAERAFGWEEVLKLFLDNPAWADINSHIAQKKV